MTDNKLKASAQRVQDFLAAHQSGYQVKELPGSTRTARDAAEAVGCEVVAILDPDLKKYQAIWAAAGTPNAVFELNPDELGRLTNGRWVRMADSVKIGGFYVQSDAAWR